MNTPWNGDYKEEVDEGAERQRLEQERLRSDDEYDAHVRDGGFTMHAVIEALSTHYGMEVSCSSVGNVAKAVISSPTGKALAAFTLIAYEGKWHLDGYDFYNDGLRDELVSAAKTVQEVQKPK